MGGGILEPGVPNQDLWRLEEEMASHTPKAWEEGGLSWTPQATGIRDSDSKGHSRNSPLAESEGVLGSPLPSWKPQRLVQHPLRTGHVLGYENPPLRSSWK